MLYVPKGFAHGFITLEDDVQVSYQVSDFYEPDGGAGRALRRSRVRHRLADRADGRIGEGSELAALLGGRAADVSGRAAS